MIFPSSFRKALESLRNDYTNGSMIIAKNGVNVFFNTIEALQIFDEENINYIAQAIKETKPTMSALDNAIDLCKYELSRKKNHYSLNELKMRNVKELETQSSNCIHSAINYIENIFSKPISIATCSYSSTFLALAKEMKELTIVKEIYVLESIWNKISHSQNTIKKLHENYNTAYEISLTELNVAKQHIDCAIIGADRVLQNGSVINGLPSESLAIALENHTPLFVLAEKIKYSNKLIIEDGFEIVHSKYIKAIFS
jgi:translation initiation factor 2B subunit (eIF-2B alpha/beta/delta family)